MEVERWDGSTDKCDYDDVEELLEDVEKLVKDPRTRKLTILPRKIVLSDATKNIRARTRRVW